MTAHHTSPSRLGAEICRLLVIAGTLTLVPPAVHAGSRSSASYSITAETTGAGGVANVQSASYRLAGSALGETGAGTAPMAASASSYALKPGYVGTLYDWRGLAVTASPASVDENGSTTQLSAAPLLDDNTQLVALSPALVTWSVLNGPLTSISSAGVATTGSVYQDTAASVQASYQNYSGQGALTVRNVGLDDFGSYAGDGMEDGWQVFYFGQNNPLAGPDVDADGTGQTNRFKFIAGLDPRDPTSRFAVISQRHPGQPNALDIIFNPVVSGRTYVLESSPTLGTGASWAPVPNTVWSDNGNSRTLTDPNAIGSGGAQRFYRVQISKP